MANLNIIDLEGKEKGSIDIIDDIVKQEMNEEILYQEVRRYLAAGRSGTHKVKGRSEVSGGGRKPWRQKGTGNARAGSTRSPLWRHGGIVFGPQPRDYSFKLNKKVIRKSKLIAISEKYSANKILVIDSLDFDQPRTSIASSIIKNLKISGKKILLVLDDLSGNVQKAFRNIPEVKIVGSRGIATYDILVADYLMFTRKSLMDFSKGFENERS